MHNQIFKIVTYDDEENKLIILVRGKDNALKYAREHKYSTIYSI